MRAPWARIGTGLESGRAFSLVELLVVVAVIGILASLLLPALGRAKLRSRQTACASNLRQVGIAFVLYLDDHEDRFPDRRDLKTELGYRPWESWPPSDPRGAWAAVVFSNVLRAEGVWMCPGVGASLLRGAPQVVQRVGPTNGVIAASYWLWRFDRATLPVPLDNFWNKTSQTALNDLREANNPAVGQPQAVSDVELAVDVYFPSTIPSVAAELAGRAAHAGGRNRLMLDSSVRFWRDARLTASR
jgi:prepilin-type N-terminal cleavage/methylation domain-containing protein